MKIVNTFLATLIISAANAQNTETVAYEVNTHQMIQTLRLSGVNNTEKETTGLFPIGTVDDSTVCLYLNLCSDYELMVNNTTFIQISSNDIRKSLIPEEEIPPISLVATKTWSFGEE